jgi:hypothetical protein
MDLALNLTFSTVGKYAIRNIKSSRHRLNPQVAVNCAISFNFTLLF